MKKMFLLSLGLCLSFGLLTSMVNSEESISNYNIEFVNCDEADLLKKAIQARNDLLVDLDKLSNTKRNDIAMVVGAYNVKTCEVTAKGKSSSQYGGTLCVEDLAVDALGGVRGDIRFTDAVRPRDKSIHDPCDRCKIRFGGHQFIGG